MSTREPLLQPVKISDLRPTQITVGMREVEERRGRWKKIPEKEKSAFWERHLIPVILGPKGRHYVIDHHHLARALLEEGVMDVLVTVVADLSRLEPDSFWFVLDNHGWSHPYDSEGRRRDRDKVPKSIADLADDPYRSLAGALRRAGGFAKDTTPFSEFLWADFFRSRIKRKEIEKDFARALKKALKQARSKEANYLPGWCGPVSGD